jgi:hypothetical protein
MMVGGETTGRFAAPRYPRPGLQGVIMLERQLFRSRSSTFIRLQNDSIIALS